MPNWGLFSAPVQANWKNVLEKSLNVEDRGALRAFLQPQGAEAQSRY